MANDRLLGYSLKKRNSDRSPTSHKDPRNVEESRGNESKLSGRNAGHKKDTISWVITRIIFKGMRLFSGITVLYSLLQAVPTER